MRTIFTFAAGMLLSVWACAQAEQTPSTDEFLKSLNFQTSDVKLPGAQAVVHGSAEFPVLGAQDAQRVLEQLWGNPPDSSVLGMIVPGNTKLSDAHSWAVVLTYSGDGYVSDEDAQSIDYNDLLKEMQEGTASSNAERERAGYGSIVLHGWAEAPRYDQGSNKLYWAKDLQFSGSESHTLNYDVRALGRNGYLSMNAVASIEDLAAIKAGMPKVIDMVEFDPGARYADFNSSTDRTAEYGLAALIGGGIAAKTGLIGKILAVLLAAKKLVILLLGALVVGISKLFGGKKAEQN